MKQFKKEVRSCGVCAQGTHSLGRERDGDSWEELSIDSVVGEKRKMLLKWSLGDTEKVS